MDVYRPLRSGGAQAAARQSPLQSVLQRPAVYRLFLVRCVSVVLPVSLGRRFRRRPGVDFRRAVCDGAYLAVHVLFPDDGGRGRAGHIAGSGFAAGRVPGLRGRGVEAAFLPPGRRPDGAGDFDVSGDHRDVHHRRGGLPAAETAQKSSNVVCALRAGRTCLCGSVCRGAAGLSPDRQARPAGERGLPDADDSLGRMEAWRVPAGGA